MMDPAAKEELITRWLPHFTPAYRSFLQDHLGRDTGAFAYGEFSDEVGRGCLAELAGRYHPAIGERRDAGTRFLQMIGLDIGNSAMLQEWDATRNHSGRREFERELRSAISLPSWNGGYGVKSLAAELDELGISMVAGTISLVANLTSMFAQVFRVFLTTLSEDIAATTEGVGWLVVGRGHSVAGGPHDLRQLSQEVNHRVAEQQSPDVAECPAGAGRAGVDEACEAAVSRRASSHERIRRLRHDADSRANDTNPRRPVRRQERCDDTGRHSARRSQERNTLGFPKVSAGELHQLINLRSKDDSIHDSKAVVPRVDGRC